MEAVTVGQTDLSECPRCEGIWVDVATLEQVCANKEKQSAVLGLVTQLPAAVAGNVEHNIRYVPCPVCHSLMNRVQFAHCSRVIVDVCKAHGTWFDRDELRRIVEFIRAGGLATARARQLDELEERRRRLSTPPAAGGGEILSLPRQTHHGDWSDAISAAAEFLSAFLRH
jgi:Zn-finger nucleic acid-binding protein